MMIVSISRATVISSYISNPSSRDAVISTTKSNIDLTLHPIPFPAVHRFPLALPNRGAAHQSSQHPAELRFAGNFERQPDAMELDGWLLPLGGREVVRRMPTCASQHVSRDLASYDYRNPSRCTISLGRRERQMRCTCVCPANQPSRAPWLSSWKLFQCGDPPRVRAIRPASFGIPVPRIRPTFNIS